MILRYPLLHCFVQEMTIHLALQQMFTPHLFNNPVQIIQIYVSTHQQINLLLPMADTLLLVKNFQHCFDQDPLMAEPRYLRGISQRQSARAHRWTAPYTRGPDNDQPRKRKEMFTSKQVILLSNSKADRVVRPHKKPISWSMDLC